MMMGGIVTSLLSGLRIHAATTSDWVSSLGLLLPQGEVYSLHVFSGLTLLAITLYYFAMNFMLSRWDRITLVRELPLKDKTNLSRITVMAGLLLLLGSLLSGMLLFIESDLLPFPILIRLHYLCAISFVVFLPLHPLLVWSIGGLRQLTRVFKPRFEYRLVSLTMLISSLMGAVLFYLVFSHAQRTLTLEHVADAHITLDGEMKESQWQQAEAVIVRTIKGANQSAAGTPVTIKALRDDTFAYFYFRWPDPTRSLKHLPLIKTEEGWQIKQTQVLQADEDQFYEDKFAVMLSRSAMIAGAGATHLGAQPLAEQPQSAGGRGLHYTTDGSLLDIWHWKAVRTGLSIGQADDNYFGQARPSKSEYKRYTAGYQKDRDDCEHLLRWQEGEYHRKPECGGFVMNWQELHDGIIQPRRLPKDSLTLKQMGIINLDPNVSDAGRWWMKWDETVRYDIENDHWPIGTVIPSVLSLGPFSQGRGGVDAGAVWRNGYWHLEIKRKLEADTAFDLPIEDDVFLWVAVFDHSQTRHSYHLHPLRIRMGRTH